MAKRKVATRVAANFPTGARVIIDGNWDQQAIVREHWPEGSSSYEFPHYRLDIIRGDHNIAVHENRVGVEAYSCMPTLWKLCGNKGDDPDVIHTDETGACIPRPLREDFVNEEDYLMSSHKFGVRVSSIASAAFDVQFRKALK